MVDFPSERNLHLWLGFSMAMLVITRWYLAIEEKKSCLNDCSPRIYWGNVDFPWGWNGTIIIIYGENVGNYGEIYRMGFDWTAFSWDLAVAEWTMVYGRNPFHQKDGWNPINNGINHLSTGAGFLPSTVVHGVVKPTSLGEPCCRESDDFHGDFWRDLIRFDEGLTV